MRAPALLVLVAACSEPPGLSLEIMTGDPAVKSVELLVGRHCEGDCPAGIVPPGMTPKAVDRVFLVDDIAPWRANVDGDSVGFRITASTDDNPHVGIVLAIGFNGANEPIALGRAYNLEIRNGTTEYVRMQLQPAVGLVDNFVEEQPPDGTERVKLWRQPMPRLPACVLAEHWEGGPQPSRDLVVPETDRDCDDRGENECAVWTHLATHAPPTITTSNCVTFESSGPGSGTCVLGGPPCDELAPSSGTECEALADRYCAPTSLCTNCMTTGTTWNPDCAKSTLVNGVTDNRIPHLACNFTVDLNGQPCVEEVKLPAVSAAVLLGQSTTTCSKIGVHRMEPPFGPFDISATTPIGTLKVGSVGAPCSVDVYWKGTPVTQPMPAIVFLDVELSNTNHLVVPALIHVEQGCERQAVCTFSKGDGLDAMLGCVGQAPPQPVSCAASGPCPNGPECGGVCCNYGESCVFGICTCGDGPPCANGDRCISTNYDPDQCGDLCCGGAAIPCPTPL